VAEFIFHFEFNQKAIIIAVGLAVIIFTHLWFFGDFDLFHGKKQVKKMKPLIVISAV